ncbi:MAG: helix-turn-helix domain-containing protein [Endomicrobia bacterium]|nr:helix-turn-helix domain-containing protein [Endomicrobiia bacterium]
MKEIGEYLKEKREAKGLSIDDVSKETGIIAMLLEGLEDGDTALFINLENYDDILSYYCEYLGLPKKALVAQNKILRMHEQRGNPIDTSAATAGSRNAMKDLMPVLKLIKDRQRVSLDLLEINFGSYSKAKELLQYLQDNGYIVKRSGASDWLINNEKINEQLRGY